MQAESDKKEVNIMSLAAVAAVAAVVAAIATSGGKIAEGASAITKGVDDVVGNAISTTEKVVSAPGRIGRAIKSNFEGWNSSNETNSRSTEFRKVEV